MNWYSVTTNKGRSFEQGIVIEEGTGAKIAVVYDPKHGPLLAAAPRLLDALQSVVEELKHAMHIVNLDCSVLDTARLAISDATQEP